MQVTSPPADPRPAPGPRRGALWPVFALIAVCSVIELGLWASDLGFLPVARLRSLAYEYGGFWPGLLQDWRPNYPGQPWSMFVTYAFLHGGPLHLAVNMMTLWSLGRAVTDRVGPRGFALLYAGAGIGGAMGFGLLAETARPMVGASGALFGLAGGLLAWNYIDRYTFRERLWPVMQLALFLVAMNAVMWWALEGQLAWQTHLGGFLAGWVLALLIDPRAAPEADDA